jgi:hypothetical protein
MKGRKSSSNSPEGGKPRRKDKRMGNFKIKWPCVRLGPITEREEERDASPAMSFATRILQNTEEQIPAEACFFPNTDISVTLPVSHVFHT